MEYVESSWAIVTNIVLFLAFGLKLYDYYARSWLAHTGRYSTTGIISYSECMPQNARATQYMDSDPEGSYATLLTYIYRIDNKNYVETYLTHKLSKEEVKKKYYKGAEVTVFYSPKLPNYSFIGQVPSRTKLVRRFVFRWFFSPIIFLNLVSCICWYLFMV